MEERKCGDNRQEEKCENKKDIKNYRWTCLLSNDYIVLKKVLTNRLEKTLDENQPQEQAGFKIVYSTQNTSTS